MSNPNYQGTSSNPRNLKRFSQTDELEERHRLDRSELTKTWIYDDPNRDSQWQSDSGLEREIESSVGNLDWHLYCEEDAVRSGDLKTRMSFKVPDTSRVSEFDVFNPSNSPGITKQPSIRKSVRKSMRESARKSRLSVMEISQKPNKRKCAIWMIILPIFLILAGVVSFLLWKVLIKKEYLIPTSHHKPLWGTGGDLITTDEGKVFRYENTLGGTWVSIPFNDTARPQADQPSLEEPWDYNKHRIHGVNLGGWLVIEPFIAPYLFEPYLKSENPPIDEWTLMKTLGESASSVIESHYKEFIKEEDFAQIASAGLNWVRIPIGWWIIETQDDEPFLSGLSWKYLLKAFEWSRKYGIRINLDLHSVPGSQNGWNHSGRQGKKVNFLAGPMGIVNAQRTLNYIRILTQFISQPEYKNLVPMFSVLNEPKIGPITSAALRSWYYESYKLIRGIGGVGEGNGPFIVLHDGFTGVSGSGSSLKNPWSGFMDGSDRVGLDTHPYLCFGPQNNDSIQTNSFKPCKQWAAHQNFTMDSFGLAIAGEWSLAVNDCGMFVNNVGSGSRFDGTYPTPSSPDPKIPKIGDCSYWNDHQQWTKATKDGFIELSKTSQDSLINSFFWTWKISHSTLQDFPPNPMWNYQLGLQSGYINPDARNSQGSCTKKSEEFSTSLPSYVWQEPLATWKTGGKGAGLIKKTELELIEPFPPSKIGGNGHEGHETYNTQDLPRLSPTGPPMILKPVPSDSSEKHLTVDENGGGQSNDSLGFYVPINGCSYLDPWVGYGVQLPAPCHLNPSSGSNPVNSTSLKPKTNQPN